VALARLSGHTAEVKSLAFSPDGRLLASASYDHTLRLWNVATRQLADAPLLGHAFQALFVAFSPDGASLASGGADHTAALWHTDTGQLDQINLDLGDRACLIAGRNLSQLEWNQYLNGQPYQTTCPQWPVGQ
jgi:WD40 repeat protein